MPNIFSFIIALLRAIPTVRMWWEKLVAYYLQKEIDSIHKRDLEAIRKAIYEHDQRELEREFFNIDPGKPSKIDGIEHRDSLPGVLPGAGEK